MISDSLIECKQCKNLIQLPTITQESLDIAQVSLLKTHANWIRERISVITRCYVEKGLDHAELVGLEVALENCESLLRG